MIFSVWNQGRLGYDYFDDGRAETSANVEKPSHLVSRTLGSTVHQAAWPLPVGAVPAGMGDYPVGRIATRARVGALGDAGEMRPASLLLLLLAAGLAWRYIR